MHLDKRQAAIRAGYSEKTARSIGKENLTKPYIKEAIAKAITRARGLILSALFHGHGKDFARFANAHQEGD
jgi:hypothetical protein